MQDEMQKMTVTMMDMKGDIDDKFRWMHDSFSRLMEAVMSNHDNGGSNASRGSRRNEGNQPYASSHRGDHVNPFDATLNAVNTRHVKLDFPRFQGGDPMEWVNKVK